MLFILAEMLVDTQGTVSIEVCEIYLRTFAMIEH